MEFLAKLNQLLFLWLGYISNSVKLLGKDNDLRFILRKLFIYLVKLLNSSSQLSHFLNTLVKFLFEISILSVSRCMLRIEPFDLLSK